MMWLVRIALNHAYTFVVGAILIVLAGEGTRYLNYLSQRFVFTCDLGQHA